MNMAPVGIHLFVTDIKAVLDYYLQTGIFELGRYMPGAEGAAMAELNLISNITSFQLTLDQVTTPAEVAVVGMQTPKNSWLVHLQCVDVALEHAALKSRGANVTSLYDNPWGGQFFLIDPMGNNFLFTQIRDVE